MAHKFYKDGMNWVYNEGINATVNTYVPSGYYRLAVNGSKIAIRSSVGQYSLFTPEYVEVTKIQKSVTLDDNYANIEEFINITQDFFGGVSFAEIAKSPSFLNLVSLGLVPGVTRFRQVGLLPNLQTGTPERDLWEFGSTTFGDIDYTYPADGTATIDTISSADATDTGDALITGLDIDGNSVDQVVTLNGQNKVTLTTSLWRVYGITNIKLSSVPVRGEGFAGEIYLYEDTAIVAGVPTDSTKVKCFVNGPSNQSLNGMWTVPTGFAGLIINIEPRIIEKGAASISLKAYLRPYGGVFFTADYITLVSQGTSLISLRNDLALDVPERADILITADSDTNGVGAGLILGGLLFDKTVWKIP